ncbi:MAG: class I SAM-dependent methyltransferase [bacterium]|nr:class I SAM-dependent methyltransferase [bacterium]
MDSFLDKIFEKMRSGKIIRYIPADSVVCDIGCGREGDFLKTISNSIKKGIGFDEKAEDFKTLKYEIKKFRILENLPLEDGSCDIVTMLAVLEHLSNPQTVLNESFRVLKKGGKLILTTPTPLAKPILEFLAFKLKMIDRKEIEDHKNYFWAKDIKKMLLKSGFEENNIKDYFFELFLNNLVIAKK